MIEVGKRFLNDYEVLGIGGKRRREVLALKEPLHLRRHSFLIPPERIEFYEVVFTETLQWLQPAQILEIESKDLSGQKSVEGFREPFLRELLRGEFEKSFPKTQALLGSESVGILEKYNESLPWQGPLLSDHFRYFSGFLRELNGESEVVLVAQKEWLFSYLSFADFGEERREPGILQLNSSLQTLPVRTASANAPRGLYVYYRDPSTEEVREYSIDVYEAEILDVLQEERKFSSEQLLSYVQNGKSISEPAVDLAKKLSNLVSQGIILDN